MRRSVSAIAVLLAGATALVGPAVAEWSALRALQEGFARCPGDSTDACGGAARVDIDWEGLRLWHPWREHAGLRVEADEVAVMLDETGLSVDAHALRLSRATREAPPAPTSPTPQPSPRTSPKASPAKAPLDTRGVPVHVQVHGPSSWSHAGVELTLSDPELRLDGHGAATASFGLEVRGRGVHAHGAQRWTAEAVDGDPKRWRAQGSMQLEGAEAVPAVLTVSADGVDAELHDGVGGRLYLRAPLPREGTRPASIELEAQRFAFSVLGTLGRRTKERWGIDTSNALLSAQLSASGLSPSDEAGELTLEHFTIDGLIVDHAKLARAPVHLDALGLEGTLSWHAQHDLAGELWVSHRGARITMEVQRSEDALDLHTELAELPCQELLDAFPSAMTEMIEGTQLTGRIGGRADLHVDRVSLERARAQSKRRPDAPAPGTLDLSFPFLERCTVEHDDPRLDLAALSTAYRHRFVDDRGEEQRRVMAAGAPGYVSLHQVPLLARAFVTLEDRRFWRHDGFDREQMVNAFWHNMVQGRVSRGASTISQQAARNLWLGVDRSWGRKLQEALLTARLESSTEKTRIMELYLNVIELGPGTHGVDEASRLYFGKPAAKLSVLQAIHLASLAPAPSRYAQRFEDGHVDAEWLDGLRTHVRRMHRAGFINRAQMVKALRGRLDLLDRRG